ncbi:MAG: hypothetical protein WBV28_02720 [Terracidiphilus sp.]
MILDPSSYTVGVGVLVTDSRGRVAGSLNEAILRLIPEFVQRQTEWSAAQGHMQGNKVT